MADKPVSTGEPVIPESVTKTLRANGQDHWDPQKYSLMYIYIFMYNKVAGNPRKFGLTADTTDNMKICEIVKNNVDQLIADYKIDSLGEMFNKEDFVKLIPNLHQHALEFSSCFGRSKGEMVKGPEADIIMMAKKKKCRQSFMDYKTATDDKPMRWHEEEGKEPGFSGAGHYIMKMRNADNELKNKRDPLRRSRLKQFLFGALTVGAAALTLTGVGALITGGGALLGGMFGGVFAASSIGGAVAGIGGGVVGGILTKVFGGKFLDWRAEKIKAKKAYLDFMRGEGDYKPDEKVGVKGYRGIKKEYELAMNIREIMTGYSKWRENHYDEPHKGEKYDFENNKDAYKAFVEKKYKKFCKKYPNYVEVVKEAIYNDQVSDNGFFGKVMGLLQPQTPTEDRVNERTVAEHVQFARDVINDKNTTMVDLKNKLLDLESFKDYFKEHGSPAEHAKIMEELSQAVVKKVKDIIREGVYTPETVKLVQDVLDDEKLKNCIKEAGVGGEIEEIESLRAFVEYEDSLNPNAGATIADQLNIKKDNMVHACRGLGVTVGSSLEADVINIAKQIEAMTHQTEKNGIEALINSDLAGNDKVQRYLKIMLEKKEKECIVDTTSVPDITVDGRKAKDIIESLSLDQVDEIREKFSGIVDPDQKKAVMEAFNKQVNALLAKEDNMMSAKAFESIKSEEVPKFFEHIDKIKKLTFSAGFDKTDDLEQFKNTVITPISARSPELGNYLKKKLANQMVMLYSEEAEKTEKYATNMEEIKTFIGNVRSCKFISSAQKGNLINKMGRNLATAINSDLQNKMTSLFNSVDSAAGAGRVISETETTYNNYIINSMFSKNGSEGYKEFFDSGTPESISLKKRIETFRDSLGSLKLILNNPPMDEFKGQFDGSSSEAKYIIKTYLDENCHQELKDKSREISAIYNQELTTDSLEPQADKSKFNSRDTALNQRLVDAKMSSDILRFTQTTSGNDIIDSECIIGKLNTKLQEINASSTMNDNEKLAALLVLRNKSIGLFKAQMAKDLKQIGSIERTASAISGIAHYANTQLNIYHNYLFDNIDKAIGKFKSIKSVESCKSEINTAPAKYMETIGSFISSSPSMTS